MRSPFLSATVRSAIAAAYVTACACLAVPASAQDTGQNAAFIGTWAADPEQCKLPQEDAGAPMIITAAGLDQNEVHCKFSSVTPAGNAWKVSAACSVQGDEQAHEFTFAVAGDKMTVTDEVGTNDMQRCQ